MSLHAIAPRTVLTTVLQLSFSLVFVGTSVAQQPNSTPSDPVETEHLRLSTPVLKAWLDIPVGSTLYTLDDTAGAQDWLERTSIDRIDSAGGEGWHVRLEHGYSVFAIYPYLPVGYYCHVCQGIYLKVNGTLSEDDLIAAIRNRTSTIKIDAYEVFGINGQSFYRHSR